MDVHRSAFRRSFVGCEPAGRIRYICDEWANHDSKNCSRWKAHQPRFACDTGTMSAEPMETNNAHSCHTEQFKASDQKPEHLQYYSKDLHAPNQRRLVERQRTAMSEASIMIS